MKVLQILPELNIGGVETGVVDLCGYFQEQGIASIVVSAGGILVPEIEKRGSRHVVLPVNKKSIFAFCRCIKKIRRIIRDEGVHIVHARSRIPFWIGFFATRTTSAQCIATMHGCYSQSAFSSIVRWIKCIICPSEFAANYFNSIFSVPSYKIKVIPRWVDTQRFCYVPYEQRSKIDFLVCYVGRLSPGKGIEYLLRALVKVKRIIPRIHLKIAGSSSKKRYIRKLQETVDRYGLNHTVEFLGNRRDVPALLGNAHITIMPSLGYESFGRVIIEGQSCGSVVISTNTGAQEEIIQDGVNGFLVIPRDADALADRIIKVLSDQEQSRRISQKARQIVEQRYTLKKIGPVILDTYRQIMAVNNILVIKLSSLGDVVLAIGSLRAIKRAYPQSTLRVLVQRKFMKILEGIACIDEIIPYDGSSDSYSAAFRIAKVLRAKSFDYCVDLQNSRVSHMIACLSLPRISIGYRRKWAWLLHQRVPYKKSELIGPIASQQKILGRLAARIEPEDIALTVLPEWIEQADRLLESHGVTSLDQLVGLHLGASSAWLTKNWPIGHIQKLVHMLIKDKGVKVILSGDSSAVVRSRLVMESFNPECVINTCGKTTIPQFVGLIRRCSVFLCPDTAALHIAVALGIPTIGIFGPTDPARHTIDRRNLVVMNKKMPCSYCYSKICRRQQRSEAHEAVCMKKITPPEIYSLIKTVMNKNNEHTDPL